MLLPSALGSAAGVLGGLHLGDAVADDPTPVVISSAVGSILGSAAGALLVKISDERISQSRALGGAALGFAPALFVALVIGGERGGIRQHYPLFAITQGAITSWIASKPVALPTP